MGAANEFFSSLLLHSPGRVTIEPIRSQINNLQLARSIGSRQEAAVENQRLARHERCAIRAHP